jgi:hypothetical protein
MVNRRSAGFGFLGGEQRLQPLPLRRSQISSVYPYQYKDLNRVCKHALVLRKPSTFIWGLRVLLEARVVPPALVIYRPLPDSLSVKAPTGVRTVYAGFILLLQCRWLYEPNQPVAYSRGFAGRWCGVSEFHAEKAIHWLQD